MFSFFKRNKYGLSNTELNYAKQLNSSIQRVNVSVLLIQNLDVVASSIYQLSSKRARVKSYNDIISGGGEFDDLSLLMSEPQVLSHIEIHKTLRDNILKKSLMMVVHAVTIEQKKEKETFIMTQEVLSVLLDMTSSRLKEIK